VPASPRSHRLPLHPRVLGCLSSPSLKGVGEGAGFLISRQPRDCGYRQVGFHQIVPGKIEFHFFVKDNSKAQSLRGQMTGERPLAHTELSGNFRCLGSVGSNRLSSPAECAATRIDVSFPVAKSRSTKLCMVSPRRVLRRKKRAKNEKWRIDEKHPLDQQSSEAPRNS